MTVEFRPVRAGDLPRLPVTGIEWLYSLFIRLTIRADCNYD
jgi:hypothetical protein